MLFFIFAFVSLSQAANDVSDSAFGQATKSKSQYCEEIKSNATPSYCESENIAKGLWNAATASNYVERCPQQCSTLKLVDRAGWGAPTPKRCNPQDKDYVQQIDKLRIAERRAYCSKSDEAASDKLIEQMQKMEKDRPEPMCVFPMDESPTTLVLHHSDGPFYRSPGKPIGPAQVLGYHKGNNEWADIGYHFIISKNDSGQWQVYEGRERVKDKNCKWMLGAHVGPGANEGALGIMIVGDYNSETEEPNTPFLLGPNPPQPGAIAKVVELVAQLKSECPSIKNLISHKEARARAFGCVHPKTGLVDETIGNCAEINKGKKGHAGCKTTCPGIGCSLIPGDIHNKVIHGR